MNRDIVKVSVVPTGTVMAPGNMARTSTPVRPPLPSWIVFFGSSVVRSLRASASTAATCFLTVFASLFADGAFAPGETTLTVPFIPLWILQ